MSFIELRIHGVSGTPPKDMLYTEPVTYDRSDRQAKVYEPSKDPWNVRAFHWGSLTAGSSVTAFWVLLAPFAMANAAGWMTDKNNRVTRTSVRLASLFLTGLFFAQVANMTLDVPYSARLQDTQSSPWWTVGMFVASALALVFGIGMLSTQSTFRRLTLKERLRLVFSLSRDDLTPPGEDGSAGSPWADPSDGAKLTNQEMWVPHAILHRLRRLHLAGGMFVLVVVATNAVPNLGWLLWMAIALGALVVLLVGATTLAPESGFVTALTVSSTPIAASLIIVTAVGIGTLDLSDEKVARALFSGAGETALAMVVLLVLAAVVMLASGSFAATGILVVGAFIGAGLGITGGVLIESWLAEPGTVLIGDSTPSAPEQVTAVGMLLLAILVAVLALTFSRIALTKLRPLNRQSTVLDSDLDLSGSAQPPAGENRTRRSVLRARRILAITGVVAIGAALVGAAVALVDLIRGTELLDEVNWSLWFEWEADLLGLSFDLGSVVGIALLLAVIAPAFFIVRSIVGGLLNGEASRRQIGILWDVGSFWPRWYHPLGPPAYAPNAVSRLQEEIETRNPLVLGAHSQGSIISAVSLYLIPENRLPGMFLSYGSQLGILYPLLFPTVGFDELIAEVDKRIYGRWINLWRRSDPIGGQYIPALGNRNWHVNNGSGHSQYELIAEYCAARNRTFMGRMKPLDPDELTDCWET